MHFKVTHHPGAGASVCSMDRPCRPSLVDYDICRLCGWQRRRRWERWRSRRLWTWEWGDPLPSGEVGRRLQKESKMETRNPFLIREVESYQTDVEDLDLFVDSMTTEQWMVRQCVITHEQGGVYDTVLGSDQLSQTNRNPVYFHLKDFPNPRTSCMNSRIREFIFMRGLPPVQGLRIRNIKAQRSLGANIILSMWSKVIIEIQTWYNRSDWVDQ